jgi:phage gpG-like protein
MKNYFLEEVQKAISKALRTFAVELKKETLANFQNQGHFNGTSYDPWKPRKRPPRKKRAILVQTGTLRKSIKTMVIKENNEIVVQVDLNEVPYAKIHNEGGTIDIPKRGISITIPQREYLANNPQLLTDLGNNLQNAVEKAFDIAMQKFINNYKLNTQ